MKERFIKNNIEYIFAEDGMYYPNLQLPKDGENHPIDYMVLSAKHT